MMAGIRSVAQNALKNENMNQEEFTHITKLGFKGGPKIHA